MILLLSLTLILSPSPSPQPPPDYTVLLPSYLSQGDGTRIVCLPTGSLCWPTNDSNPSTYPS